MTVDDPEMTTVRSGSNSVNAVFHLYLKHISAAQDSAISVLSSSCDQTALEGRPGQVRYIGP